MVTLRSFRPSDIDSLYAISLATGHAGGDAWHLYIDGRLMGHIYVGPYAKFSPETVLVAEDEEGVGGYILGVFDTAAFEDRLEEDWWPGLRAIYPEPSGPSSQWNADERRCFMIHHLRHTPESLIEPYPAHVHMNLLPRLQQQGIRHSAPRPLDHNGPTGRRRRHPLGNQYCQPRRLALLAEARICAIIPTRSAALRNHGVVRA